MLTYDTTPDGCLDSGERRHEGGLETSERMMEASHVSVSKYLVQRSSSKYLVAGGWWLVVSRDGM
jgi:hypothetical protein